MSTVVCHQHIIYCNESNAIFAEPVSVSRLQSETGPSTRLHNRAHSSQGESRALVCDWLRSPSAAMTTFVVCVCGRVAATYLDVNDKMVKYFAHCDQNQHQITSHCTSNRNRFVYVCSYKYHVYKHTLIEDWWRYCTGASCYWPDSVIGKTCKMGNPNGVSHND